MTADWIEVLLRQEGKGKLPTVNPLAVPRFINRSESFIGINSDADTTGRRQLHWVLHYTKGTEKQRKKERKKERKIKKERKRK